MSSFFNFNHKPEAGGTFIMRLVFVLVFNVFLLFTVGWWGMKHMIWRWRDRQAQR